MFSIFSRSDRPEPVVLIHIGSASVGVALAEIGGPIPSVHFTARGMLPFQDRLDYDRFFEATFTTLESLLKSLTTEGVADFTKSKGYAPHITKVGLVLSSTWYVSKTLVLSEVKDKQFRVTSEVLRDLAASGRKAFETEIRAGTYPHIGTDAVVLEESLVDASLNGYSTHDPLQKMTKDLKVSLLVSLMSASFSDRVFETIDRVMSGYTLHPHSYGLTAYSIIRDLFPEEKSFLIVDIDGELTDVAVVKDEVLSESISFPCGKHSVLRCLGDDLGPVETRAKLLERTTLKNVKKARDEWLAQYTAAIGSLAEHVAIPNRVFISGNSDVLPWFSDILLSYEGSAGVFAKPRMITPLTEKLFIPHLSFHSNAHYDGILATLLLFFDKAKKGKKTV